MRVAEINRKTNETDIKLKIDFDGKGQSNINTGCGFLDHMLTLFARHASFNLDVNCVGDTDVDYHHTVEDIGIVLGSAIKQALNDMKGIKRYGNAIIPMDETLILVAIDISGRSYLACNLGIPASKVGDFDTELVDEFFAALVRHAGITLHIKKLDGSNSHHIIEGAFKAFARALKAAVRRDVFSYALPSSKGVL